MKLSEESKERLKSAMSSLRAQRNYKPSVIKVKCFICKKESSQFEVYGNEIARAVFCQNCIEVLLRGSAYHISVKNNKIEDIESALEAKVADATIAQNLRKAAIQEKANAAIQHFEKYLDEIIT